MPEWIALTAFLAALAHAVFATWGAGHALLNKRDPRSALGWSAVCIFVPYFGPFAYLVFGINRIKGIARKLDHSSAGSATVSSRSEMDPPRQKAPEKFRRFRNIADSVTRVPLVGNNRIQGFDTGEQAYASMLEDIRSARKTVMLATYIFRTDRIGKQFISELKKAVGRGVDVWVLVDGVGELYSWPRVSGKLRKARVRCAKFIPFSLIPLSLKFNLRNHRKILITDGWAAHTGGINIGDQHVADKRGRRKVADMHFRLTGPVVTQIETVFIQDWEFVTGEHIDLPVVRPAGVDTDEGETPDAGTRAVWCRTISDGPDEDLDQLAIVIDAAISSAQQSVHIVTPYFLPSAEMIAALTSAALRGVDVSIVLPARSNLPYVDWASRNMLWQLLKWGVKVYQQPAPFAHTKLFLVDDCYAQIGSANIDPRSLRLNFEIVVEILDTAFVEEMSQYCHAIIRKSRPVTFDEIENRSYPVRLRDSLAWLFSPYL